MKELTIGQNDAGQRLDRFLAKAVPLLPASLAQKYIRLKRIKRNGQRAQRDTRLEVGDKLQLYINDEFFDTPREDNAYLTVAAPKLNIVYEDEHILLVDKRPGLEAFLPDHLMHVLPVCAPFAKLHQEAFGGCENAIAIHKPLRCCRMYVHALHYPCFCQEDLIDRYEGFGYEYPSVRTVIQ